MDSVPCDIYGDRRPAIPDQTVTAIVDGEVTTLEVCEEHYIFFRDTLPENYAIGRTFTGEVEVRHIPKQPATPADPPTE